jgi:hypothetical protein
MSYLLMYNILNFVAKIISNSNFCDSYSCLKHIATCNDTCLDTSEGTSEVPGKFEDVVLEKNGEDQLDRSCEK